ncbi:hypothetical protein HU200_048542 [Digitaria exilis]|uniref:F-box domain-containing protein n=1 Tax=Digitaria exilis TaxID=1010633 RepID=A0A835AWF9_9POAL|nr:hypothetical protein HU200_048542 [Digitaria exilis]
MIRWPKVNSAGNRNLLRAVVALEKTFHQFLCVYLADFSQWTRRAISIALPDELLHAILAGVGKATAVTRTAVLSKRWRRSAPQARGHQSEYCFAGFVDWVLACRGDTDIYRISRDQHAPWVNEWLLYATRRVVKAFCLELAYKPSRLSRLRQILEGLPPYDVDETAVVLPSHGRMASIEMGPSCYRLELPVAATAMYEALTELKLSHVSLDEDAPGSSGRTLDDFVSPCVEHNIAALQVVHITTTSSLEGFSSGAKCICDQLDTWRFHQKFFLGSLEEVAIHGFAGAGEDLPLNLHALGPWFALAPAWAGGSATNELF